MNLDDDENLEPFIFLQRRIPFFIFYFFCHLVRKRKLELFDHNLFQYNFLSNHTNEKPLEKATIKSNIDSVLKCRLILKLLSDVSKQQKVVFF